MTLGQEMRWAYSTKLPSAHGALCRQHKASDSAVFKVLLQAQSLQGASNDFITQTVQQSAKGHETDHAGEVHSQQAGHWLKTDRLSSH